MFKFGNLKKRIAKISPSEIFVILTICFSTIFLIKFFGIKKEWRTIKVEVIKKNWSENYDPYGYRTPFWLSNKIKKNQSEKDKSGKIIAQLLDFDNYERGTEEAELYLTVKVRVTINKRTGQYFFKDKEISLGSPIELDLDNNLIFGQIIDNNVPANNYPVKNFIVTVRGKNLEPNIINNIIPNDKMINRSNNETVIEIIDVVTENPTSNLLLQKTQLVYNPRVKDVLVKARVKAYQQDNRWFFTGHQNLKVGNPFYFYGKNINLYDLIIEDVKAE